MTTETTFAGGVGLQHGWTEGDDHWGTGMETNLRLMNMLVQARVIKQQTAEPVSPTDGDMYLTGSAATGTHWSTHNNAVAAYIGTTWYFYAAHEGLSVYNLDQSAQWTYDGSAWGAAAAGLTDAPSDGTTYGRKDGAWEAVAGGGAVTESILVALGDETTDIITGTALVTIRMPYAFTVTDVRASLATASSSGNVTVDINEAGVTILSTKLSIDATEKTSTTAATPAVISDTSLADDAEITFDIDAAGTGAKGLKVTIIGHQ